MRIIFFGLCLFAQTAVAEDGLRETDIKLSEEELTTYLSDQVLSFFSDGVATYHADGVYTYQYSPDGNKVPGVYEIMEDGSVCTVFANGFDRCDFIVQAGERHVMIIANGDRYPIKTRTALAPTASE